LFTILFSACKKYDNTANTRTPAAALMAFNLTIDKATVGVTLSGINLINAPLNYTSYTGGYIPVYLGSRDVKSYDFNSATTLATSNQLFQDSVYYSLFVVGNNGSYHNIISYDSLRSLVPSSGQAFVRYVNVIPDSTISPLVTISSNGTNFISNNTPFGTVSGFTKVNVGNITIGVNSGDSVAATRTIAVEESKAYTILLTGIPHAVDTAKAVQIKFITNGTITP
jgi:hypothetical protein